MKDSSKIGNVQGFPITLVIITISATTFRLAETDQSSWLDLDRVVAQDIGLSGLKLE